MSNASLPGHLNRSYVNSDERLRRLAASGLLDSGDEEFFARIVRIAMRLADAPVGLFSLVEATRQYFKVAEGLPTPWEHLRETPLSHSFCRTVVEERGPLLVEDARLHPEFGTNPVVPLLGVVAYCGVPLKLRDGHVLGSLCVIDARPRSWTGNHVELLSDLAGVLMAEVERRLEVARHRATAAQREEALAFVERTLATVKSREQAYHALVEGSVDGIVWVDAAGVATEVNAAAARILAVPREKLIGVSLAPLVGTPPASDAAVVHEHEVVVPRPDGSTVHLQVRTIPMGAGDRQVVLRDIETRTQLERQLRHATKLELVGRLAGTVAHDFNNALVAVQTNIELASRELLEAQPAIAPAVECLAEAQGAVRRGAQIARQLLAVARKPGGDCVVVDIADAVAQAAPMLARLVGLEMAVDCDPGSHPLPVCLAPGGLDQILLNLASNAREASGGGGTLRVSARAELTTEETRVAVLVVSDTGPGIPADLLPRIFEPFFTTRGDGTGLGLYIVKGIVEEARGTIEVQSAPRAGTTFTIRLPLSHELPVTGNDAPSPPPSGRGERILVVDDDRSVRDAIVRSVERAGYRTYEAQSSRDALRVCQAHEDVALVVTDDRMPGLSGRELVGILRARFPAVPTLVVSGYRRPEGEASGAVPDAELSKPFERRELLRVIASLLAREAPSLDRSA